MCLFQSVRWSGHTNLPTCWKYVWDIDNIVCICLLWIIQVIYCRDNSQKLHQQIRESVNHTGPKKKNWVNCAQIIIFLFSFLFSFLWVEGKKGKTLKKKKKKKPCHQSNCHTRIRRLWLVRDQDRSSWYTKRYLNMIKRREP